MYSIVAQIIRGHMNVRIRLFRINSCSSALILVATIPVEILAVIKQVETTLVAITQEVIILPTIQMGMELLITMTIVRTALQVGFQTQAQTTTVMDVKMQTRISMMTMMELTTPTTHVLWDHWGGYRAVQQITILMVAETLQKISMMIMTE